MTHSIPPRAARAVGVLGALLALPALLSAQATAVAPTPADTAKVHAEVRAVITGLFDHMRRGDTAAMRAVMHPSASLLSSGERNGAPVVTADPVDGWLASIGRTPAGTVLDERVLTQEVRVDGGLASAWVEYEFWVGERFSHCGVDAFILGRTAEGWRILSLADTRRRTGCRQPPAGR
jgi:hypothetical protein